MSPSFVFVSLLRKRWNTRTRTTMKQCRFDTSHHAHDRRLMTKSISTTRSVRYNRQTMNFSCESLLDKRYVHYWLQQSGHSIWRCYTLFCTRFAPSIPTSSRTMSAAREPCSMAPSMNALHPEAQSELAMRTLPCRLCSSGRYFVK